MKAAARKDRRIMHLVHGSNSVDSKDDGFMARFKRHQRKKEKPKRRIEIGKELDPYSGAFDLNKIINGQTPYKKDEFYDKKIITPRSVSKKKAQPDVSETFFNKSSSSIPIPDRKHLTKSKWPNYKSWSASTSSQSTPETEYESYSCEEAGCHKPRITPVTPRVVTIKDHCERETLQRFRDEVPLENRGFSPDLPVDVNDYTNSRHQARFRTFESDSAYTYSYSSCSRSSDHCDRCLYVQVMPDNSTRDDVKRDVVHRPRAIVERDLRPMTHSSLDLNVDQVQVDIDVDVEIDIEIEGDQVVIDTTTHKEVEVTVVEDGAAVIVTKELEEHVVVAIPIEEVDNISDLVNDDVVPIKNFSKGSSKSSGSRSSRVKTPKDLRATGSNTLHGGVIGGGQKKTIIM